jgi:hypothetical protein
LEHALSNIAAEQAAKRRLICFLQSSSERIEETPLAVMSQQPRSAGKNRCIIPRFFGFTSNARG